METLNPTSDAVTTQTPSAVPVEYGGFWRRWFALFIDQIILGLSGFVFGFILGLAGLKDFWISFAIGTILNMIYRAVYDSSRLRGTPGKALMGLAIVTEGSYQRISFKTATVRMLSSYLSGLVFCVGYLMQPFTSKRQTLHDMIAETVVIRVASKDGENYITAFTENFKSL